MIARRLALCALAAMLLGATAPGVSWFTPDQALRALLRDDTGDVLQSCMQQDAKGIRAGLIVAAISSSPQLALVQIEETCICGNVNCPFWIYRVDGRTAKQLLTGYGYNVNAVARPSGLPDVVSLAHDSALVTDGTRYTYRNGRYVVADSWRLNSHTDERKPMSIEIKFAPGTSSARLSGNVSTGWNDVYTFAASAGQRLTISAASPKNGISLLLFRESNAVPPVHVDPTGKAVGLPVSGRYQLSVDPAGSDTDNVRYAFTLTIR